MPPAMSETVKARCRGCGVVLKGTPYHLGGSAIHPRTGKVCKANYYGGWVCSPQCDYRSSLELEHTMPGHGTHQARIGCFAQAHYDRNWEDEK